MSNGSGKNEVTENVAQGIYNLHKAVDSAVSTIPIVGTAHDICHGVAQGLLTGFLPANKCPPVSPNCDPAPHDSSRSTSAGNKNSNNTVHGNKNAIGDNNTTGDNSGNNVAGGNQITIGNQKQA